MINFFLPLFRKYFFPISFIFLMYPLIPILFTGFNGDDAYNYQVAGKLIDQDLSFFEFLLNELNGWIQSGRILFGYSLIYSLYIFSNSFIFFKTLTFLVVLLSYYSFFIFLNTIDNNKINNTFILILVSLCLQLRYWHDPILIFPSHIIPLLFLFLMCSLILFNKYLKTQKKFFIVLSSFFYLICLVFYELSLTFILLYAVYLNRKKKLIFLRDITNHLIIFILFLSILFYIKYIANISVSIGYESIDFSNLSVVLKAFIIQLIGMFPLSYSFFTTHIRLLDINLLDCFFTLLFFIFLFTLIFNFYLNKKYIKSTPRYLFISFFLIVFPALVSAISVHNIEIVNSGLGFAYSPVIFQYFGFGIIIFLVFNYIISKLNNKIFKLIIIFLITFLCSFIFLFNISNSKTVINQANQNHYYPQKLQQDFFNSNLSNKIKAGDIVYRIMRYPNDWKWSYFSKIKGRIFLCDPGIKSLVINKEEYDNFYKCIRDGMETYNSYTQLSNFESVKDTWALLSFVDKSGSNKGHVVLAKINNIIFDNEFNKIASFKIDKSYLFSQNLKSYKELFITNILEGYDYEVLEFDSFFKTDNKNIQNILFWNNNINSTEIDSSGKLNWVSGNFSYKIYNDSFSIKNLKFVGKLINPAANKLEVNIVLGEKKYRYVFEENHQEIKIPFSIKPYEIIKINFYTINEALDNGDPRKIIYGIRDFTIEDNS